MSNEAADTTDEHEAAAAAELTRLLSDYWWRINNLYKIRNTNGIAIPFIMNFAQQDFAENMHFFNLILKARQLGFSTFIDIDLLDTCLFYKHQQCGIIAQGEREAFGLLDNVRFTYNALPDWLKEQVPIVIDNMAEIEFGNGSKIIAGISLRSGTYQKLHVSEYGKTSAKFPDKAREIKTGALNTVHVGQVIHVESTAEGQAGEFFELCKTARKLEDMDAYLTPLDPKFHFYPWWKNPDYVLSEVDTLRTVIDTETLEYFKELEKEAFITLTQQQKAWYYKKKEVQGEDMWREFPSTPDEAFKASVEGAIYPRQMRLLRKLKRITSVPHDPRYPVYTYWDFGNANYMAIWFVQYVGREKRMIRYYQDTSKEFKDYIQFMNDLGYIYGGHYVPHDGATVRMMETGNKTYKQAMENLGLSNVIVVPMTRDKWSDIEFVCKPALMEMWIDEQNCSDGIKCLDNYKKAKSKDGVWLKEPDHDEFSDGSDAFRTYAKAPKPIVKAAPSSFKLQSGQRAL